MENINNPVAKRTYKTVDLFKLLASILVVLIHVDMRRDYAPLTSTVFSVSRIAVPFFFLVSGYLFCRNINKAENKKEFFWKYEKKLLLLYFSWMLITAPFTIKTYCELYEGRSALYIAAVIARRILFAGNGVFWYILIMAEAAAILFFLYSFCKKHLSKLILVLSIIGLALGTVYLNRESIPVFNTGVFALFNKAIYFVFSWDCNVIMKGFPFMGIGYLICENADKLKTSRSAIIARCVAFAVLTALNYALFLSSHEIFLLFIFQAILFFTLSLSFEVPISQKAAVTMRELSSSIYFIHSIVIYDIICTFFENTNNRTFNTLAGIIVPSVIYVIVKLILKKRDIKWLKFILNIK